MGRIIFEEIHVNKDTKIYNDVYEFFGVPPRHIITVEDRVYRINGRIRHIEVLKPVGKLLSADFAYLVAQRLEMKPYVKRILESPIPAYNPLEENNGRYYYCFVFSCDNGELYDLMYILGVHTIDEKGKREYQKLRRFLELVSKAYNVKYEVVPPTTIVLLLNS